MFRILALGLVLAFWTPLLASAEQPAHAVAAETIHERLGYFVGRWRVSAHDPRTSETIELTYAVERTPGGTWLAGSGASQDGSFNARDMWGLDPLTGELVRVIFDGSGAFATLRASAWNGNTLVLEGEARSAGGVVRVREMISIRTADQFEAVWAAHRDGAWVEYSVETVTRQ